MAINISGNIQDTPLADVVEGLRVMKATGTFQVTSGAAQRSLYLQEGRIVFASSTDLRDRLGEVLVRAGKLKREDLERSLDAARRLAGFKKLGAILVEGSLITPRGLFDGLKLQVKEIIYNIFTASEGTYQFDKNFPADIIPLQIDTQGIIKETAARMRGQG